MSSIPWQLCCWEVLGTLNWAKTPRPNDFEHQSYTNVNWSPICFKKWAASSLIGACIIVSSSITGISCLSIGMPREMRLGELFLMWWNPFLFLSNRLLVISKQHATKFWASRDHVMDYALQVCVVTKCEATELWKSNIGMILYKIAIKHSWQCRGRPTSALLMAWWPTIFYLLGVCVEAPTDR